MTRTAAAANPAVAATRGGSTLAITEISDFAGIVPSSPAGCAVVVLSTSWPTEFRCSRTRLSPGDRPAPRSRRSASRRGQDAADPRAANIPTVLGDPIVTGGVSRVRYPLKRVPNLANPGPRTAGR